MARGDKLLQFKQNILYVVNISTGEPKTFFIEEKWKYKGVLDANHVLETSSIARHRASPLEKAIKAIEEKTVYYNEKTLRWHNTVGNRFSPGQSTLDEAAGAIRIDKEKSALEEATAAPDDEMVAELEELDEL